MNGRIHRVCITALAAILFGSVATAQTMLVKDRTEVSGSRVHLGEVATITGVSEKDTEKFDRVPICLSPMPGVTRDVGSDYLVARARQHGVPVDDLNIEGARRVRITSRSGNGLTPESLAMMLEQYILDEMPWARHEAQITCRPGGRPLTLPAGEMEVRIEHRPEYDFVGEGVFPTSVFLDGRRVRSMYLRAYIDVYRPVVVAGTHIGRGSPIRSEQLDMRTASLSAMNGECFVDPSELNGMVARRDLAPGTPITPDKVEAPIMVRRREDVMLEHDSGSMKISLKVRARTQGRIGDVITVDNLTSRKVLSVVVTGPGEVRLP